MSCGYFLGNSIKDSWMSECLTYISLKCTWKNFVGLLGDLPPFHGVTGHALPEQRRKSTDAVVSVSEQSLYYWVDPETEPCVHVQNGLTGLLDIRIQDFSEPSYAAFKLHRMWDIQNIFCSAPISYLQMRLTWRNYVQTWRMYTPEVFSEDEDEIWLDVIMTINQNFGPHWILPCPESPEHPTPTFELYEWVCGLQTNPRLLLQSPSPPKAPRERFIIHFFSGRRRKGDLQSQLEAQPWPENTITHVLSLDVIFGEQADLSTPQARSTWLSLFYDSLVWGFYAGPPCESWSRARSVKSDDIKVHHEPWGLASTSIRELRQILTANMLMFFVLLSFALQAVHGSFGLMEHPQTPENPELASIWRTKLWCILEQLPTSILDIAQGYFGAPSSKPTTNRDGDLERGSSWVLYLQKTRTSII